MLIIMIVLKWNVFFQIWFFFCIKIQGDVEYIVNN